MDLLNKPRQEHTRRQNYRVLFLVSSMQGGGAERVAAHLCNRWVKNGHEVVLMPTFSRKGECRYPLHEGVCLKYLADYFENSGNQIWHLFGRFMAFRRLVREIEPDVIVSFLTRVNVATIFATRGMGVRVLVSERNNPVFDPDGWLVRFLRRITYRYADLVVVQTDFAENWIKKKCATERVRTIPNPVVVPVPVVEPIVQPSVHIRNGRRVVLAVGRMVEQKNFGCLIEAFSLLAGRFPEWDLVLLGEGELKEVLEQQCREAGLEHRAVFPGRVGNLSDWYRAADVYAMSSLYEGFPNTLLEALAHGVPAVSFDCEAGPRDLIDNESNGLLVATEKGAKGLAQALTTLMADPDKREAMRREASRIAGKFSIENVDRQWSSAIGESQ